MYISLCTRVGNEVTDERPLFSDGISYPSTNDDNTSAKSSVSPLDGMQESNVLNINKHPFFTPMKPFVCSTEDMIQLLQLTTPSYLYQLSIIKDKQQALVKEEKENMLPLVINILRNHSEQPMDQYTLQQYLKERSCFLHHLLGELMPAATKQSFIKKVKRNDTWIKS
ncbi:uncharacterized protein BX664DRAFT_324220 [Halteromyces radiatus]|uniref:uncharacterized protein n=1 Tax=Halteromyces radiatus TaxID=101107 RepID=UPI00221F8756|nr:uncharacterized protein BX664DRAFT_324220 [Halteromyces radiatus]KAI8096540.1 hypothetical protein BX664DRAFT_324220 [Halteromyces radiatus]